MTQGEMARKLGCDRKTIINYEVGVSDIRVTRMFIWLKSCKVDNRALLMQVKQIREQAKENGKAKLQDAISIFLVTIQLWVPEVIAPIYLVVLAIAYVVSLCK
ncbi:helix-turn-helix domain-containing protein, partial [Pseudoalteromonas ruthenica]|uniref:helix-turn-helix domain-containing protein n=1 Tax=Pseudoalteromonas ruthenica TaxID=151081 RepID=UPI0024B55596